MSMANTSMANTSVLALDTSVAITLEGMEENNGAYTIANIEKQSVRIPKAIAEYFFEIVKVSKKV